MTSLTSDTVISSLVHLTADEQNGETTTVVDLRVDPPPPGHSFHRPAGLGQRIPTSHTLPPT